jgi:REP element-mobilizing transposase RayT
MVLGYHVIFGAYGFWLPNDPRRSCSDFVASWELSRFGKATTVNTRRSLAHVEHDGRRRQDAKRALKHPPAMFSGVQARSIGRGFARACAESGYVPHACSILPEHVHLVIGRHDRQVERIIGHFKTRATQQLKADGVWSPPRPVWAAKGWTVFLDTRHDIARAVGYVEANPQREGKPPQRWAFVVPLR